MKAFRSARRVVVNYVRDVKASIAPLPDPAEKLDKTAALRNKSKQAYPTRHSFVSLARAFPIAVREYRSTWNDVLYRQKESADNKVERQLTRKVYSYHESNPYKYSTNYKVENSFDHIGAINALTSRNQGYDQIAAAGLKMIDALKDCLVAFLSGYREGKLEEEQKGPLTF
mmetsp:Transcript_5984/g.6873  ORF Transcript_5984/g.6873 Transcript_5984/m.6873 type:complete len:171 (+) Transcript_5984:139-651(+)